MTGCPPSPRQLLDEVGALEDRLSSNELDMSRSIKAKCEKPGDTAGRVIDLPPKPESGKQV